MILNRISKMDIEFTELEKQLAEFVLAHAEEIVYIDRKSVV